MNTIEINGKSVYCGKVISSEIIDIVPKGYRKEFDIDDLRMVICQPTGSYRKFIYDCSTGEKAKISQAEFLKMKEEHKKKQWGKHSDFVKAYQIEQKEEQIAELEKKLAKLKKELEEMKKLG